MTTLPEISCVLPAHNAAKFLPSALDSLLTQSFQNFELIAVNDGSTDATADILQDYSHRDPRIRVLHQPSSGIVAALNNGISQSRAPLIARMDGDDLCRPHRFASQTAYMRDHPHCVLLGSRVRMIDRLGWPIGDMASVDHGHDVIDQALLIGGWPIVHPAVMFRRSAFNTVGGYRPGTFPHEDHDLFLRLAEVGTIDNHPDTLLDYRRHLNSVTFSRSHESHQVIISIIATALQRRGQNPLLKNIERNSLPIHIHRREWVWQALREGHLATARKHVVKVVLHHPLNKESWRAAYCALRGH